MEPTNDNPEFTVLIVKFMVWLVSAFATSMVNVILGNTFLVLSISYLLWKWRRDYVKNLKEQKDGTQGN